MPEVTVSVKSITILRFLENLVGEAQKMLTFDCFYRSFFFIVQSDSFYIILCLLSSQTLLMLFSCYAVAYWWNECLISITPCCQLFLFAETSYLGDNSLVDTTSVNQMEQWCFYSLLGTFHQTCQNLFCSLSRGNLTLTALFYSLSPECESNEWTDIFIYMPQFLKKQTNN